MTIKIRFLFVLRMYIAASFLFVYRRISVNDQGSKEALVLHEKVSTTTPLGKQQEMTREMTRKNLSP